MMNRSAFAMTLIGRQHGNVLFIILIAVGLFAALSYTVSSSFRGGTSDISQGQARVTATEMLAFHSQVKDSLSMLLSRCSENELDLSSHGAWHSVNKVQFYEFVNANKRDDDSCTLFHPKGGGLTPRIFNTGVVDLSQRIEASAHPGHGRIQLRVEPGFGTELVDLMLITDGVSDQVCEEVNKLAGNPRQISIVSSNGNVASYYAGTFPNYTQSPWIYDFDYSPRSACITQTGSSWMTSPSLNNNHVVTVIYAR